MKASLNRLGTLIVGSIALAATLSGCGEGVPACEETRTCQPDDAEETDTGPGGGNDTGSEDESDSDDSSTSGDGDDDETSSGNGDGDEPSSCADGTFDHDDDSETKCKAWSTCEPGQYVSEEGTPTTDKECTACDEGTFSEEDDAEECGAWTECPSGVVEAGTASSDVVCASPAVDVAVGDGFSCILREDGTVACWGKNDVGQLGQGHTNHSPLPQPVMAEGQDDEPLQGVVQLSVGAAFGCALREDASVWCWGDDAWGQLGTGTYDDGDFQPFAAPVDAVKGAIRVVAGGVYACVVNADTTATCWGNRGEALVLGDGNALGNGDVVHFVTVATGWPNDEVSKAVTGVVDIACGWGGPGHTCLLTNDGGRYCWSGDYATGAAGPMYASGASIEISDLENSGVETVSVAAGADETCWLETDGSVYCHGLNALGNFETRSDVIEPALIPPPQAALKATDVALDYTARCILYEDGSMGCWGKNDFGQLGNGKTQDSNNVVVVEGLENIVALDAGYSHACAVDDEGRVSCWGKNENGELGDNTIFQSTKPLLVPDVENVTALTSGSNHTCALLDNGKVKCWGANDVGQLGIGSNEPMGAPLQLGISEVIDLRSKYDLTYAVKSDHSLRAWGTGLSNLVATSDIQPVVEPVDVKSIALGGVHACAIKTDQTLSCWGVNYYGSLGTNEGMSTSPRPPVEVADVSDVVDVAGGYAHTCALSNGEVTCWGLNDCGQVGLNDSFYSGVHFLMPKLTGVTQLALGRSFSMALLEDGSIAAWGRNLDGELGDGTNLNTRDLVDFVKVEGVTQAVKIGAGIDHACAVLAEGGVTCWGKNDQGQVGIDRETQLSTPQTVPGLASATNVSAGLAHTCALHEDGTVSCWGTNESFQLGRARMTHSSVPQEVIWQ